MQGALGSTPVRELDPLCHAAQLSIRELKNLRAEDIQLLPLSDLQFQGLRSPVVNERALGSYRTACAARTLVLWPHR